MERVSLNVNERRKLSVMGSSSAVRSRGVTPEQQIKSRMCAGESGMLDVNNIPLSPNTPKDTYWT